MIRDCGLFALDACALGAWNSATGFLFGWFFAIPWGWFIAGLFIGAILGARFGWLAVVSIGTSVLVGLIGPRLTASGDPSEVDGADAAPSPPEPRPRERKPAFPRLRKWLQRKD